ncbi:MAG: L-lactate dehydrogenase [Thermosipho sp. (in: Bacteria)]|jgi:L-lactate dehydrogenase|nr:L-lactate dehydrogenase [Thermosipho sp. (in: thermotogales)]
MKISIIGAGRVGTSIAYSLLHRKIANEIVIIDKNYEKAYGEALDLYHGTSLIKRCNIYAGNFQDLKNSDIVIITAGAAQKVGETRLDLTKRNYEIIKDISKEIKKYSNESIVINVTNPVDVLTYFLWKELDFPKNKVIGTGTILDTARFRALVSKQCGVSPASVHAYIVGEHGDSELMVWSSATIGGVNIKDFCKVCNRKNCRNLRDIFEETKNAAYTIIEKKGATNFAIGVVTAQLVESIFKDEKKVLTPSTYIDGIFIGFPAIVGKNGIERIIPIEMDEFEISLFENSKNIIRKQIEEIEL